MTVKRVLFHFSTQTAVNLLGLRTELEKGSVNKLEYCWRCSCIVSQVILDKMVVGEMVGKWLQRGEDDRVTEEAGLHVVTDPAVSDQLILTCHPDRAH